MKIIEFSLVEFYKYRIREHGLWYLFGFTSGHYPRFFSRGFYNSKKDLIVIAISGNWKLRLEHEKGHARGLKHTPIWKIGYIMHPWGILRGSKR